MRRRAVDERHAANLVGSYYDVLVAQRKHTWDLVAAAAPRSLDPQHPPGLLGGDPARPCRPRNAGAPAHRRRHGIDLAQADAANSPQMTAALTYQDLAGLLYRYLAPGPPDPAIRTDILAVRQLLLDVAPPTRVARQTKLGDRRARETLSALHGTCDIMSQIAQMNRVTFATLARSEHVHLPARIVTGDELSDDPDQAQQKLDGARTLIATPQRLEATLATYDKLIAVVPASQPYQPPIIRAGTYDHPALLRKSEFV